jgi:hypothetical protein
MRGHGWCFLGPGGSGRPWIRVSVAADISADLRGAGFIRDA